MQPRRDREFSHRPPQRGAKSNCKVREWQMNTRPWRGSYGLGDGVQALARELWSWRWSRGLRDGAQALAREFRTLCLLPMSANAQAKGLLAELMQCHPASELAGNCLQLAALVAVPQNEEERRTQQHPS